ncbi:MAG: hypothetical protein IT364_09030 [Candidatus Hydrogenedentes bacterium]|nr:hypothetical protein [Candidatus Hydrogenedentota bacterium]
MSRERLSLIKKQLKSGHDLLWRRHPNAGPAGPVSRHNVDAFGWYSYPNHAAGKQKKAVVGSAQ